MKKLWIAALIALSLTSAVEADFLDFHTSNNKSELKDNQVMTANSTQVKSTQSNEEMCYGTTRGSLFSFVKPAKRNVSVGQSIQVSLKLKRKAYIYIIAVSNRNNKAYMILPNRFEGYNLYHANRHYVVPERSAKYRFISDAPGTETLYVIASTYKQNFDQLLNKFGKKEVDGFRISSVKSAQSYMKDILVVPAITNRSNVEVRKLHINVR